MSAVSIKENIATPPFPTTTTNMRGEILVCFACGPWVYFLLLMASIIVVFAAAAAAAADADADADAAMLLCCYAALLLLMAMICRQLDVICGSIEK
jgi:hypothetical protein